MEQGGGEAGGVFQPPANPAPTVCGHVGHVDHERPASRRNLFLLPAGFCSPPGENTFR